MALGSVRLTVLLRLAEVGSVRGVARSMGLSPSTVSAHLAALERETGASLAVRSGRSLTLTPAGHRLVDHARVILDRMATAQADVTGLDRAPTGVVRLGAFSSAIRSLVIPAALRLGESHPGVVVEVTELDPRESHPALRRGEVDLIVTSDIIDGPLPLSPDVRTRPLLSDAILLVLSADDPRAAGGPVDLGDFRGDGWASDAPGTYIAKLVSGLCRGAGFEPRIVGSFASYELLLAHVERGLSIALLPSLAIDSRYGIATRPLRDPVSRDIYLAVRESTRVRAVDTVIDALVAVAVESS